MSDIVLTQPLAMHWAKRFTAKESDGGTRFVQSEVDTVFTEIWADGKITRDEYAAVREFRALVQDQQLRQRDALSRKIRTYTQQMLSGPRLMERLHPSPLPHADFARAQMRIARSTESIGVGASLGGQWASIATAGRIDVHTDRVRQINGSRWERDGQGHRFIIEESMVYPITVFVDGHLVQPDAASWKALGYAMVSSVVDCDRGWSTTHCGNYVQYRATATATRPHYRFHSHHVMMDAGLAVLYPKSEPFLLDPQVETLLASPARMVRERMFEIVHERQMSKEPWNFLDPRPVKQFYF
jgi:hypothetical protein